MAQQYSYGDLETKPPSKDATPTAGEKTFDYGNLETTPTPSAPPVDADRGVIAGIERGVGNVIGAPGSIITAASAPPRTPEENVLAAAAGGLGLAAKRLLWDPAFASEGPFDVAKQRFNLAKTRTNPLDAAGDIIAAGVHGAAGLIPFAGPWAESLSQRATGTGKFEGKDTDYAGAAAELGTTMATGGLAGKAIEKVPEAVKSGAGGLAKTIQTRVTRPSTSVLNKVRTSSGQNPSTVFTENMFKHDVGGTPEQTFYKADAKIRQLAEAQKTTVTRSPAEGVNLLQHVTDAWNDFEANDAKGMSPDNLAQARAVFQKWVDKVKSEYPNGTANLADATKFKMAVGDDGDWSFGTDNAETRGKTVVSNAIYPHVRGAIETAADKSGGNVAEINRQLGELIPIRRAALARMPVAARNEAIGLKTVIGAATGHPAAAVAVGANAALKSHSVANALAGVAGIRGTAVTPEVPPYTSGIPQAPGPTTPNGEINAGLAMRNGRVTPIETPTTSSGTRPALPAVGATGFPPTMSAQDRAAVPGQTPGLTSGPSVQDTSGQGPFRRSGGPPQAVPLGPSGSSGGMPTATPPTTPPSIGDIGQRAAWSRSTQLFSQINGLKAQLAALMKDGDLAEAAGNNVESQTKQGQGEQLQTQIQQLEAQLTGQTPGLVQQAPPQNTPVNTQVTPTNAAPVVQGNLQPETPTQMPQAAWSSQPKQIAGQTPGLLPPGPARVTPTDQAPVVQGTPEGAGFVAPGAGQPQALPAAPPQAQLAAGPLPPAQLTAATEPATTPPSTRNIQLEGGVMRPQPTLANEATVTQTPEPTGANMPQANDVLKVANEYNKSRNLPPVKPEQATVNEPRSQAVSDFYTAAESTPTNPAVKRAYDAFKSETADQYAALTKAGYKFEPSPQEPPYPNAQAMAEDLVNNKHLFVSTANSEHPLLTPEQNFQFRAVHDTMAHAGGQATFGHQGEETAYYTHKQMYSPEAQKAMATETRGQNATTHFRPGLNPESTRYQTEVAAGPQNFPEQKAVLLPGQLRARQTGEAATQADMLKNAGYAEVKPEDMQPWHSNQQHYYITRAGKIIEVDEHARAAVKSGLVTLGPNEDIYAARDRALQQHGIMRVQTKNGVVGVEAHGKPSAQQMEALASVNDANPHTQFFGDWRDKTGKALEMSTKPGPLADMYDQTDSAYNQQRNASGLNRFFQRAGRPDQRPLPTTTPETPTYAREATPGGNQIIHTNSAGMNSLSQFVNGVDEKTTGYTLHDMTPEHAEMFQNWANGNPQHGEVMNQIAGAINDANGAPTDVHVSTDPITAQHEIMHGLLNKFGVDFGGVTADLPPEFAGAVDKLASKGYDVKNPETLTHELLSFAGSNDTGELGTTPAQNTAIVDHILGRVAEQAGPEGLQEILDNLSPQVRGSSYERNKLGSETPYGRASEGPGVEQPTATSETPNAPGRTTPGSVGNPQTPDLLNASERQGPAHRIDEGVLTKKSDVDALRNYWEPRGHSITTEDIGHGRIHVYRTPPGEGAFGTDDPQLKAFERRTGAATEHLTPTELAGRRQGFLNNIQSQFENIPSSADDLEAAAQRGAIGRKWYRNSAQAIQHYFGDDAPTFTRVLASLSPQMSVQENLRAATEFWDKYDAAGKPTDADEIRSIFNSVPSTGGEKFTGRFNNVLRTLTGQEDPLSARGPKVRAFDKNLNEEVDHVTLDGWMAKLFGMDPKKLGDAPSSYLAGSARVREVAKNLGWAPDEVQAASWSFIRPVWNMIENGTPAREALRGASVDVRNDVMDFARLLAEDNDVRSTLSKVLERQGRSLDDVTKTAPKPEYPTEKAAPARFSRKLTQYLDKSAGAKYQAPF